MTTSYTMSDYIVGIGLNGLSSSQYSLILISGHGTESFDRNKNYSENH